MDASRSTSPAPDLLATLARLRAAQQARRPDYRQRMADLARLDAGIVARTDELVDAASADFGRRSRHETLAADIMIVREEIKFLRRKLKGWMRPRRRGVNLAFLPARAELRPVPLGVVGIVSPWNYPVQLALLPLADAIAAGNHVMLKPSEFAPRTSAALAALLKEVFPEDRVAVVLGGAEVGAAFCALPFDHLLFTGSTVVGRKVMAAAAPNLCPVTLELGGKSPVLVAPDYPLEHAAERVAAGKFFNGGQTCVAPDYVLVPRAKRDEFTRLLMASLARRYPTLRDNPDYTAIINARQASRLRAWIDDARAKGLEVLQHAPDGLEGADGLELVPPTLVIEPGDDALVMCDEIFGPVLPIVGYDDHDAAIARILGRERPLAFYPFDRDRARLARTLDAVVAGSVCVNDTLIQFGQHSLPIGGVGASGMGRYHGEDGFNTFSQLMPVMRQARLNTMFVLDPPYGRLATFVLKLLLR